MYFRQLSLRRKTLSSRLIRLLTPHFVYKPWGGKLLARLKQHELPADELLGETWEVSRLREGPSQFANGEKLTALSEEQLPYLVKFIDTTEPLSVQVHPGDEYAKRVENSSGKTECWVILKAKPGAGLYLGFKPETKPETFFAAAKNGEDISSMLMFYPVKAGDFFYVPAGTVHALGGDITLAEIQQSSGVTYRVWDWNRVDAQGRSRELHLEKSQDVLNFDPSANQKEHFNVRNIFTEEFAVIQEHEQFRVSYCPRQQQIAGLGVNQRVISLVNLENELLLQVDDEELTLKPYQCVLLPKNKTISTQGGHFLVVE